MDLPTVRANAANASGTIKAASSAAPSLSPYRDRGGGVHDGGVHDGGLHHRSSHLRPQLLLMSERLIAEGSPPVALRPRTFRRTSRIHAGRRRLLWACASPLLVMAVTGTLLNCIK
jgi:hypothetical protein